MIGGLCEATDHAEATVIARPPGEGIADEPSVAYADRAVAVEPRHSEFDVEREMP